MLLLHVNVTLNPFFKWRHQAWSKTYSFMKSILPTEIKLGCVTSYLAGVLLFLFIAYWSLPKTPRNLALPTTPPSGVIYKPVERGCGADAPRWQGSRASDWFTHNSPAQLFYPDQAMLPGSRVHPSSGKGHQCCGPQAPSWVSCFPSVWDA